LRGAYLSAAQELVLAVRLVLEPAMVSPELVLAWALPGVLAELVLA
jgi:hypothetical protein